MNFVIDNWSTLIIIPLIIAAVYCYIINEKRMAGIWLLEAVSKAEKEFGGGTGVLKLHNVYDRFIVKFPALSRFMTFAEFSLMVDKALEEMRHLIETNPAFNNYITGGN